MANAEPRLRRGWNWWKIGFFTALIALELAREAAVVAANDAPTTLISKFVYGGGDYVSAEGRWRRTDGGDPLTPGLVKIECERSSAACHVIEVLVPEGAVWPPEMNEYPARFSNDGVAYSWNAGCVQYDVRIDTNTKQVVGVRRLLPPKQQSAASDCSYVLDERIEMVLADGYGAEFEDYDLPEDRWLPLLRLLRWIL